MKLLPLEQILSLMDIEKIVVNKDSLATNVASLRNSNANFNKIAAIEEFTKNLNENRRSEQKNRFDGHSILNQ